MKKVFDSSALYVVGDGDNPGRCAMLKEANLLLNINNITGHTFPVLIVDLGEGNPFDIFYDQRRPIRDIKDFAMSPQEAYKQFESAIDAVYRQPESFVQSLGGILGESAIYKGYKVRTGEFRLKEDYDEQNRIIRL